MKIIEAIFAGSVFFYFKIGVEGKIMAEKTGVPGVIFNYKNSKTVHKYLISKPYAGTKYI